MDKQSLRAALTAARRESVQTETSEQRARRAQTIAGLLFQFDQLGSARSAGVQTGIVASHQSLASEPPTDVLNRELLAAGFQVIVPVHEIDGQLLPGLQWVDMTSGNVVAANGDDFRELPVLLIVTPALAIGRDGTRLGKGKGYYDRFFASLPRYPTGPQRVGIVGPTEIFDSVPVDGFDQPIDDWVVG